jgi:hypothetical protein
MFSGSSFFAAGTAVMIGGLVAFSPATAHATVLSDCGNIDLSGNETCQLETSGGCTVKCNADDFQLQCSADLETSCSGGCNFTADVNCTTACVASCTGGCTTGSFSCEGSCDTDCNGHCSADCTSETADGGDETQCMASCKETCDSSCSANCSGTPPSCTQTTCQAECQGSCQAQANIDCQVNCQESGSASCESNYLQVCQGQCSAPQGALFCNGQYVNVDTTQLQACLSQLSSELDINVSLTGSTLCDGGTCSVTGSASASCGQIAPGAPAAGSIFGVGLGLGIAGAVRRRERKSKKGRVDSCHCISKHR